MGNIGKEWESIGMYWHICICMVSWRRSCFMFPEEDRLGGDVDLISVMQQVPVVVTQTASARALDDEATPRGLSYQGDPFPWLFEYPGAVKNIKSIADAAAGVGMVATVPEIDGVVRRMPTAVRVGEKTIYPSK